MSSIPGHATDFIRTYKGALSRLTCRELIDRFEADPAGQVWRHTPNYSFTELNVSLCWPDRQEELQAIFHAVAQQYAEDVGLSAWWPQPARYEQIRMKRYRPNGIEQFQSHLDVRDYASAKRFLVMFLYLNEVTVGGGTCFPQWGAEERPEPGKILAFPPQMPFVHAGELPVSGPKYILGTYAHYV